MTVKRIDVAQEQVTASDAAIYNAPTAANFESAEITFANCTNEGTVDTTLTINIVQTGEAAAVTNRYLPPRVIFAGSPDPLTPIVGATLKNGDFISSIASLASNLNLKISIKEIYTDT
tara:strand:- start:421 stop:774 length:354 start_codon:yes stop_codon:yes gene_type:complete